MPRWLVIAVVSMATLVVASAVMIVLTRDRGPRPESAVAGQPAAQGFGKAEHPPDYPPAESRTALTPDAIVWQWPAIPAFTLTDQDGKETTEAVLDGRITVVDFIFTNCPYACPGMTGEMTAAAGALKGTPVRFVSFSVDPERDTPERLRWYAAEYKADLSRWTFLTGPFETVRTIASDTLMFDLRSDVARPIELADGTTMNNVVHPSKIFLIGPDRRLLAMYEYTDPQAMLTLAARARAASAELQKKTGR